MVHSTHQGHSCGILTSLGLTSHPSDKLRLNSLTGNSRASLQFHIIRLFADPLKSALRLMGIDSLEPPGWKSSSRWFMVQPLNVGQHRQSAGMLEGVCFFKFIYCIYLFLMSLDYN